MSSDNTNTKFAVYTDDSGVVITQAQYAELHGEQSSRRGSVGVYVGAGKSLNNRPKSASFVRCEYCNAKVSPAGLVAHKKIKHPIQNAVSFNSIEIGADRATDNIQDPKNEIADIPDRPLNPENKIEQARLIVCPTCNVQVKASRYKRHIAKVHAIKQLPVNRKVVSPAFYRRVRCSLCVFVGDSDSVIVHMKEKHGLAESSIQILREPEYRKTLKNNKQAVGSKNINTKNKKISSGTKKKENINIVKVPSYLKCLLCDHRAFYGDLFVHIQICHPEENPKKVMAEFNREFRKRHMEKKINKELDHVVSEYEKLKQSHDEPRDAGKYMGFMRRENGKFGSLPLHDNYSDESDAA